MATSFKEFVINEITKTIKTNEAHAKFWIQNHCAIIIERKPPLVNIAADPFYTCSSTKYIQQCELCNKFCCDAHSVRRGAYPLDPITICINCIKPLQQLPKKNN